MWLTRSRIQSISSATTRRPARLVVELVAEARVDAARHAVTTLERRARRRSARGRRPHRGRRASGSTGDRASAATRRCSPNAACANRTVDLCWFSGSARYASPDRGDRCDSVLTSSRFESSRPGVDAPQRRRRALAARAGSSRRSPAPRARAGPGGLGRRARSRARSGRRANARTARAAAPARWTGRRRGAPRGRRGAATSDRSRRAAPPEPPNPRRSKACASMPASASCAPTCSYRPQCSASPWTMQHRRPRLARGDRASAEGAATCRPAPRRGPPVPRQPSSAAYVTRAAARYHPPR